MSMRKNKKQTLPMNQNTPGIQVKGGTGNSGSQPPKKRIVPSPHIRTMATYSTSMTSIEGVDQSSTIKPATSSDSASSRSKGGRLVSAIVEMKNTTNIVKSGRKYQLNKPKRPSCAATISLKFSE